MLMKRQNTFFLLDQIADDLELNEDIKENYEGDQIDGFIETVREIVEKLINEIKESLGNTLAENQNKKTKFIKALIRIFSILLNANLNSAKKITKVIKQSVKLVLSIWQGEGLDKLPTVEEAAADQEAPEQETSKSQDLETNESK